MARGITLKELKNWLDKNEKHTWSLRDMAGWKKGSTHLIKYMYLSFDTRTMDIFAIEVRGLGPTFGVHTSSDGEYGDLSELKGKDNKDNSILDLLDYKIEKMLEKQGIKE